MLQCRLIHIQADYLYGRLPKFTHGWRGSTSICSLTLGSAILMVDLLLWLTKERPSSVTTMGIDFAKVNSLKRTETALQETVFVSVSLVFRVNLLLSFRQTLRRSNPTFIT